MKGNVLIFVQARMGSARFPGKVLKTHNELSLLGYQIERLKRSNASAGLKILTSTDPRDDLIESWCNANKIDVFRGNHENVAERFIDALNYYKPYGFARVCSDSPFYDPKLLDFAIENFCGKDLDIVTNKLEPTFPRGQSIEVCRSDVFKKEYENFETAGDREHVMLYFYRNSAKLKILNFRNEINYQNINLCVDTEEDFSRFKLIIDALGEKWRSAGWEEVVSIYKSLE